MSRLPEIQVRNSAELEDWLARQGSDGRSHWLIHGRKAAGESYLPYGEMVEALLAHGWIDSRPRAVDQTRSAHLISPRKPGSAWSRANRERIAKLEKQGRMTPAGRRAVEQARRDGSWDRLRETETGTPPADLAAALAEAGATDGWDGLTLATRRRSLEFLLSAKREETRRKRIGSIVAATAEGRDPTAWRPKG